jgi:glycosyltransferase involved in cell wall biosynthesis
LNQDFAKENSHSNMKLCIISRRVIQGDGQSRVNYEVIWESIYRGYQVTLLSSNISPDLQLNSQVTWIDISVEGWPTELLRGVAFSCKSAAWLRQHFQDFDLVIVNGANTTESADVNAVHFVHSSWLKSSAHPWRRKQDIYGFYQWLYTVINAQLEKKSFRQAKLIVAVSEKIKQELIYIGVPQDRIRVILNGVDLEEFSPSIGERSQFGLPEDRTLALFAGDIRNSRKNLDTVLYALVQVPELHLVVVGAVEESPYLKLTEKLELDKRVYFLGYRLNLFEIMKAVDFFVLPSRYEPFGMVVSEAMATGMPVIISASTGAAEIVTPECGIVLIDSEDVHALSEALARLASDRLLRNQMGQRARVIAEQHSWSSKAKSYVDLFEEFIKE